MSGIASGIHSYSCALGADSIPIFILRTSKVGWDGFSSESPFYLSSTFSALIITLRKYSTVDAKCHLRYF